MALTPFNGTLDAPSPSGLKPFDGQLDGEEPQGGLIASLKRTTGQTIAGIGQAAGDYLPGVSQDNALKRYGQEVIEANPTAVNSLSDIADKPWTALKEATGNAAASIGSMVGAKALGQGVSAVAPFTGPARPIVAALGKGIEVAGPTIAAALPSYGGIRQAQQQNAPEGEADSLQSKALAAGGAGLVGLIEGRFGPENWALKAMGKEGREQLAKQFAADSLTGGLAKGALKGAATEGAEEIVQNPIEQLSSYQDPTTAANVQDTLFGGAMGALGGGVFGGGAGGLGYYANRNQPQADPSAGPLSRAAATAEVSGATANAMQGVGQAQADPFADVLGRLTPADMRAIRAAEGYGPESVQEVLRAASLVRNPEMDPHMRQQAADALRGFWQGFDNRPNWTRPNPQAEQPAQPGTAVAPVGQSQAVADPSRPFFDPNTLDGDATEIAGTLPGAPRQLVGPEKRFLEAPDRIQAKRDADAAYEQAFQDLVKAEQLGASDADLLAYQQALADRQAVRDQLSGQLADTDARVQGALGQQSTDARRSLLDTVLNDPETKNPLPRFESMLKKQGYAQRRATDEERQAIERFQSARDTFADMDREQAAPNELDAAAMGIRERQPKVRQEPPKQRAAFPMSREGAERQAAQRSQETGQRFEVTPHPTVAGRFAVQPVADQVRDATEMIAPTAGEAPTNALLNQGEISNAQSQADRAGPGDARPALDRQGVQMVGQGATAPDTALQVGAGAESAQPAFAGAGQASAADDAASAPQSEVADSKLQAQARLYRSHPDFLAEDLTFVAEQTDKTPQEVRAAYDSFSDTNTANLMLARTMAKLRGEPVQSQSTQQPEQTAREQTPIEAVQAAPQGPEQQPAEVIRAPKSATLGTQEGQASRPQAEAQGGAQESGQGVTRRPQPRTLLSLIQQSGGINSRLVPDITGERTARTARAPIGVFRSPGMDVDMLAEVLQQHDYLTQAEIDDVRDNSGGNAAIELVRRALGGERITSIQDRETEMAAAEERAYQSKIKQEASEAGIRIALRKFDDIERDVMAKRDAEAGDLTYEGYDELTPAARIAVEAFEELSEAESMAALGFTQEEINEALGQSQSRQAATGQPAARAEGEGRGDNQEAFGLTAETNEEVAAREAAQKAAEQQSQADEQERERRAQADAERSSFVLTGSDRAADVQAAQGQGGLFDAPQAPAPQSDDGVTIRAGKGRIADQFLAELNGESVPGGPWDTQDEARAAAEQWRASKSRSAEEDARIRQRKDALAAKIKAGGEITRADLDLIGLRAGSSDLRWFIPSAADLFGISSRAVRPFIKDMIRVGHTDMGAERESVTPEKALKAIADGQSAPAESAAPQAPQAKAADISADTQGDASTVAQPTYDYTPASKVESTSQGMLVTAREQKKRAFDQVKRLRQQIKDEPLNGNRSGLRLDLLKAEDRHREYQRMEAQALEGIEADANRQGKTTKRIQFSRTPWTDDLRDALILRRSEVVQAHPDYRAAKDGDLDAAFRLVRDTVTDADVQAIQDKIAGEGEVVVAVHAEEASGRNQIPMAFAAFIADRTGMRLDDSIVQTRKVSRGGSDGFHRIATEVPFRGAVTPGAAYLIVDDTLAQGGTLASLKGYIESNGGRVIGASSLMGKQYSSRLAPTASTLSALRAKYGAEFEQWWENEFGYGFDRLTESEARYLASLRGADADSVRDRVIAARQGGVSQEVAGDVQGAPRASREDVSSSGTTQSAILAAIRDLVGPLRTNRITVAQSADELVTQGVLSSKDAQGTQAFVKDGRAYFIAGNIRPGNERAVFLHEIGAHLGMEKMLSPFARRVLLTKIRNWAAQSGTLESHIAQAAQRRVEAAGATGEDADLELLAYTVEEAVKAGVNPTADAQTAIGQWFRQFMADVRKALEKLGLLSPKALTAQDIVNLAHGAANVAMSEDVQESSDPRIQFSRAAMPDWLNQMPQATQEAARKAGIWQPHKPLKERLKDIRATALKRVQQGLVDQFAPLKELGDREYVLARLTKSSDAPLEALLLYGKPFLNDAGAIDVNLEKGGLIGGLQKLEGEHDRFFAWMAGNRAEQLKAEGRENLFTDTDITALKDLNQGNMPDGSSRAAKYNAAKLQFSAYSKAVLDIAEKAGIIAAEDRAIWEKDFYVPFYRAMEDGDYKGPRNASGLVNQYAFKKLKGGTDNLNDLMQNTLRNWSHLLSASLKNQASAAALESAEAAGVATPISQKQKGSVSFLGRVKHKIPKGQSYVENGVTLVSDGTAEVETIGEKHYMVDDPFILNAITSLEFAGWNNPAMKMMQKAKHYLTLGVTISPTFKIRNLIRDQISAIGLNPMSYNLMSNLAQGWKGTDKDSAQYAKMLAGGGLMRFGTFLEDDRAEHMKRLIQAGVSPDTILDTKDKVKAMLGKAWDWWQDVGDRSENITRASIYQQRYDQFVKEGKTADEAHLLASFAARDSMDFSLQGQWGSIRFLTQLVPFLGARLQGLYKLGREGVAPSVRLLTGNAEMGDKERAMRFGAVTGTVALASIALFLAYRDDDDWKDREEWDRDAYWWFKVGDTAFRIPKPFEIGAIGTIAERGLETALNGMDKESRRIFIARMWEMLMGTFAMNPVPQLFKPVIDLYANTDSFTGRPIETMGMERLSKAQRIGPGTSATAQLLGKATSLVGLSPVQVDHLIEGYFSWLGTHAVMTTDFALRPLMGLPDQPARKWPDGYFVLGDFAKDLPSNQSKYLTQFYEQSKKVQEAMADIRYYQSLGQTEKALELSQDNADKVRMYGLYTTAERQISGINKQIKAVQMSSATADVKREQIDRLTQARNQIAKAIESRRVAQQ